MTLYELIKNEEPAMGRRLFVVASIAGLANVAILGTVNAAAQDAGHVSPRHFVLFALCILLFVACSRYSFKQTALTLEQALYTIKMRVVDKILRTEVERLEQTGSTEIFDRLTENVTIISSSVNIVAFTLQSILVVIFAGLYMAFVSLPAFVVLVIINVGWALLYFAKNAQVKRYLQKASQARVDFLDLLSALLTGFKQVKISRQRSEALRTDIGGVAEHLRSTAIQAHGVFSDNLLVGNSNLFVLLGGVVFLMPQHDPGNLAAIPKIIGAILFVWGPLQSSIAGIPSFMRANMAMTNIHELEERLDEKLESAQEEARGENPWKGQPISIEARDLEFAYHQENESFHIGPLNLKVKAGEVLFIVGGNGSGKSTFLKVLTGFYPPSKGHLRVGDVVVAHENLHAFREMISIVFTDFYLFKKLYGVEAQDPERVRQLLKKLQLDRKTSFADGRFSTQELSTGQRKRLALLVALLEDRPIYAFDELAADQDPAFRHYFYEELIPELRQRGKTLLVISHDDRYFHCADRVVTMEYGQIRKIEAKPRRARVPS